MPIQTIIGKRRFFRAAPALLAATVVSAFESTITRWTALVVFLPLISAVAGNAGVQALTVLIPFGLKWCKIDPATASGIFVTTLTDILGFLVFLGLAAFALRAFGL